MAKMISATPTLRKHECKQYSSLDLKTDQFSSMKFLDFSPPTKKKKKKKIYARYFLNKVFSGIWHNFQLSKYCINWYPRLSRTYLEPKLYETMWSCTRSCIFIRLKSLSYEINFYNTITKTNLLLILSYCLIK